MLCICMLCTFCSSCPVALYLFGACFPDSSLGKGVVSEGCPDFGSVIFISNADQSY